MRISVIVCSIRSLTLRHTIQGALAQRRPFDELIVVDQSGAQDTKILVDQIGDPRIILARDNGKGLSRARNIGLSIASGDVVAYTDDDCVPEEGWLSAFADAYERFPDICMVAGSLLPPLNYRSTWYEICPTGVVAEQSWNCGGDRSEPSSLWGICGGNVSYNRKALMTQVGWFDVHLGAGTKFPFCDDDDVLMRIRDRKLGIATTGSANVRHAFGVRTSLHALKYAAGRA